MKVFAFAWALVLPFCAFAQTPQPEAKDPTAILILDQMADVIGDLESCSFSLETSHDVMDQDHGFLKNYAYEKVYLDGPNKLMVEIKGTKGKRGFWYNGSELDYYSYKENNYVSIPAPGSTLAMIDSINAKYDITFPAADFFYPSLTDDIIEAFDSIQFVGKRMVDGQECFLIKTSNAKMDMLLYVANDAYRLPKRHVIKYKEKNGKQYEATFSDWQLNPNIPNAIFEFKAPASARQISIQAKK